MKLAIAQITTDPGKLAANSAKIAAYIERARAAGADLVVFPELSLPGYNIMDLAFHAGYIRENRDALERIAASTDSITAIVGFIDCDESKRRAGDRPALYNSAAILRDKRVVAVQDKTLLPDYDIFFEDRYFLSARQRAIHEISARKVGIQICEDLWDERYAVKVSRDLVGLGADLLVNLSASPFHVGKLAERASLVSRTARDNGCAFAYANLVGAFDGFDGEIVFDGRSMIFDRDGGLLGLAKGFEEDLLICDLENTLPRPLPAPEEIEELHAALCLGIKEYFRRLGFERAYVGLSGGIDSAVVACLAVSALGPSGVIGVTMPSHVTSGETKDDALRLAKNLGIDCKIRPIGPEYEAWRGSFEESEGREPLSLTRQNKQARIRGAILMEYSNEDRRGLVVSTGNKTELALGYCTLYGDMCGGFAAISDVSKERIYELARLINRREGREVIPNTVIERVPTAELEPGQTDRANLPADYPVISPLVDAIVEENATLEDLAARYPRKVAEETIRLVNLNEFKRRQAPPGIRVTKRAFGIGRRVPMGHGYNK